MNEGGDTGSELSVPTSPRRFGELSDLVVPDAFDAPLPEPGNAVWKATDPAAQDAHTARITVSASDLRRFADAYPALGDPSVMDRAWE